MPQYLVAIHRTSIYHPSVEGEAMQPESPRIAIASSWLTTGWLRRRAIPARLRTITLRSNGPMPMRRNSALIAPGLPWAVRARAAATQRALPASPALPPA